MAQTQSPILQIEQFFRASPEALFDAWTKPELMKNWLFKSEDNQLLHVHTSLTVGGQFSILEKSRDVGLIDHFGQYHLIERPHRLSFSLEVPKHVAGVTQVALTFTDQNGGCGFTFEQTGGDPQAVEASWRMMFERLAETL